MISEERNGFIDMKMSQIIMSHNAGDVHDLRLAGGPDSCRLCDCERTSDSALHSCVCMQEKHNNVCF